MDRQHRRDLKHDKFVDEIGTLSTRARENQRILYAITGATVIIALLVYGYLFYKSGREQRAQEALASAIQTVESPLLPPAGNQPVPNARFKTEAERSAAAERQFKDVETKFGGSDAADIAGLYLARLEATKGDIKGAKAHLQRFVDRHPKHFLVGGARYSIYQLRIDSGEAQQVGSELQTEVAKSEPILPPDTLLILLAHSYDAQGYSDKSKDTYRRIATEFPDSPYAVEAQRRIGPA